MIVNCLQLLFSVAGSFMAGIESATCTGIAVDTGAGRGFLASRPSGQAVFVFVDALDPYLAHVLVPAHLGFGKPSLDDYAYAHRCYPYGKDYQGGKEGVHGLEDEFGADRLVVVNLPDDGSEGGCHGDYLDLPCVRISPERNSVGHVDFLQG